MKKSKATKAMFYFDVVNDMYVDNPAYITLMVRYVEGLGMPQGSLGGHVARRGG